MRPDPETITLGDKSWLIRPLTLRQIRELSPLVTGTAASEVNSVDLMIAMLCVALRRDHEADANPEALLELETSLPEFKETQAAIMRLSGLRKAETHVGEGGAAPLTATTGEPSTDV